MQAAYQRAIEAGVASPGTLDPERTGDALFGLGECLCAWAEEVTAAAEALPDDQLTQVAEAAAQATAAGLLHRGAEAFQQVGGDTRKARPSGYPKPY